MEAVIYFSMGLIVGANFGALMLSIVFVSKES